MWERKAARPPYLRRPTPPEYGDGAQPRTKVDLPAPAAAAAAAAAAATVALGSGFVDVQRATAELGAVDAADSRLGGGGVRHLDEGEAARAAGGAVGDDAGAIHLAVSRKDVAELLLGDVERTITNVNLSHGNHTPTRKG